MKPGLAVLPLEVWADIFLSPYQWINRQKLAHIADNIKDRKFSAKLQKLLHGCGKHKLECLEIDSTLSCEPTKRDNYDLRKRNISLFRASLGVLDHGSDQLNWCLLPESEMPENIGTINQLKIRYFDDEVLHFLNKIKRLFTNVVLQIEDKSTENMRIFLGHLLALLGNNCIRRIACCYNKSLQLYAQHFPEALANAKELVFLAEPASIPVYLDWLNTPLDCDQHEQKPKFSKLLAKPEIITAIVDAVRKNFMEATTSSTFVIYLEFHLSKHGLADEFTIGNATTNEQLAVRNAIFKDQYGEEEDHIHYVEIVRHPIGAYAKIREWIKKRAYYEKFYGRSCDEAEQIISVERWEPLTVGHISKK